jgi:hypothetical protein
LADFWVVVLQQKTHQTEARLQAHKVVVQKLRGHHVLDKQLQAVESRHQSVLLHEREVVFLLRMLAGSGRVVGEPDERRKHFVDALFVRNLGLLGVERQDLLNLGFYLLVHLFSQLMDVSSCVVVFAFPDLPEFLDPGPLGVSSDSALVFEVKRAVHDFLLCDLRISNFLDQSLNVARFFLWPKVNFPAFEFKIQQINENSDDISLWLIVFVSKERRKVSCVRLHSVVLF